MNSIDGTDMYTTIASFKFVHTIKNEYPIPNRLTNPNENEERERESQKKKE